MKIIRYQSGGIYYTPFFGDEAQTSKSSSSSSSSEDKEEQMIKKEIISILKENGLQNDVDYFLSKARQLLNNSMNLGFGDSSYDMGDITRLVSLANRTRRNFESYTNARDQIIKQGAGSDLAISNRGGLYVLDSEGELKTISPDSYYKNSNKYRPLTNTDLMQLRENDSNLAFNSSVLSDMSNAVGMQTIVDYIKSTINAFGTSKETKTGVRFTEKTRGKIEEGFQQILSGVSPDGIYKYSIKQSTEHQGYNDNTNEGLLEAVTYLYNTLAPNMKNVLRANCAAKGMDPNKAENVHSLLIMAIQEHTNHGVTIDEDIAYDATATKNGNTNNGNSKMEELTREQMGAFGTTISPSKVTIHTSDGSTGFTIDSQSYGKSEDRNKDIIGRARLIDVLRRDRMLGHQVDSSSITFGNQLLKENDLDRVVYDGVSNIERITMAYDTDVYASSGKIVPDLDAANRYQEFLKWCDEHPDATPNIKLVKAQNDYNLDVTIDQNGQFVLRNTQLFYVINGYASNQAFNFNDKSKWLTHIDKEDGKYLYDIYSRIINYGGENTTSTHKTTANFKRNLWVDDDNTMYKGLIFMPITDPNISTVTSGTEFVPQSSFIDIQNRNKLLDAQAQIKTNW